MKSIIQEASSIAKAVEEGWIKAQKPQNFSVKVLEEAEKNFLGLTKKSAKVAIFFEEKPAPQPVRQTEKVHRAAPQHKQPRHVNPQQPYPNTPQKRVYQAPVAPTPTATESAPAKKQFEPLWNQAMVDRASEWMTDALRNAQHTNVSFFIEPQKFHLRITLSQPILSDPDKEKQLLASFSALILETLKRTFKMSLRGHKIVLTHQPK